MSILVTGAAGFVGSHLVERLLEEGRAVVGLDSFDPFYDPAVKERNLLRARDYAAFREVRADIRDPELEVHLPEDIEAVMHLAARAGVRHSISDPATYADVNVTGTAALLALAHRRRVAAFVLASSSSVYGDPTIVPFREDHPADHPVSPYAATKRAAELQCAAAHARGSLGVLCARIFTVVGSRQRPDLALHRFARRMREGRPLPMFGDGSSARDYTDVSDVVEGLVRGLRFIETHEGALETVNLGGGRPVRLHELIRTLAGEMGASPRIERLPRQPGDVRLTHADLGRARALLGYTPRVPFAESVRRFVAWFDEGRVRAA